VATGQVMPWSPPITTGITPADTMPPMKLRMPSKVPSVLPGRTSASP